MSTENQNQMPAATEGCAAAAGYVAALENALAAAIVSLYITDREDMLAEFTFDEIAGCVSRTRKMQALKLEHIYSLALRYPRPQTSKLCIRGSENKAMKNTQDDTATEGCAPAAGSDADYLRAHGWKESGGDWLDPKFRRFTNFQQAVQDQQRRDACTHQTTFHLNGQTICNDCGNAVNQNVKNQTPPPRA